MAESGVPPMPSQIGISAWCGREVLVTAVALSIVLDNFGWLGLPHHPATWPRLLGGALAIGGVILVSLF